MKRKILSTLIALSLCMTSAFAATLISGHDAIHISAYGADALTLTKVDVEDIGSPQITASEAFMGDAEDIAEAIVDEETARDSISVQAVSGTIDPDFLVKDITVKPLVLCIEDQSLYSINGIYRQAHRWSDTQPRFQTLYLTQAETVEFYKAIDSAINTLSAQDGRTYSFIGWDISTQLYVQAERPQSIRWTPSQECLTGTTERTMQISYQGTDVTIREFFQITADDLSIRKYLGIRGGFYFLYPTGPNAGSQGSIAVSAGFTTNSDL